MLLVMFSRYAVIVMCCFGYVCFFTGCFLINVRVDVCCLYVLSFGCCFVCWFVFRNMFVCVLLVIETHIRNNITGFVCQCVYLLFVEVFVVVDVHTFCKTNTRV